MVRKNIPIETIYNRENHLIEEDINEGCIKYCDVANSIAKYGIANNARIPEFFKECVSNNHFADINAKNCISLLSEMEEDACVETSYFYDDFINSILPSCKDLDSIKEAVESSKIPQDKRDMIMEAVERYKICSRVLNNHAKLSSKYDMPTKLRECRLKTVEEVTESICELVDTYDMPVNKKLNVTLEEVTYLYDKTGLPLNKSSMVETTVDYLFREHNFISDKEMDRIKKILNTNPFIESTDIIPVNYIFTENISYDQKMDILTEAAKSSKYKALIKKVKECKVFTSAKDLIVEAFNLITSSFIIAGAAVLADVTILIAALFILIINIASHSTKILKILIGKSDELKKAKEKTDNEFEQDRYQKVINLLDDNISKAKSNSVKESASIIDQTIDDTAFSPSVMVIHEPDPEFSFNSIEDIVKESKDYADSDDVQDLIKRYKAEQNKTEGKFKRMITAIYTKSPAKIIDDTPHILGVIRNFLVIGTFVIPHTKCIAGIISFCVDKYVAMDMKRSEAEKVCKYFNNELKEIEKKIDKTTNQDKLDDLKEYKQCLEKAIEELERYRDNLYSEKELDAMNNYDEAANISVSDKLTIDEYYEKYHEKVVSNISYAIQIFKSEILRRCGVDIEEYEMAGNESVSKAFSQIPREGLISNFINIDGIINVPLFMINNADKKLFLDITAVCSHVNSYIGDKCMVSNFEVDGKIYVIFNFLHAIYLTPTQCDQCATEEFKEAVAYLNFFQETVEEIVSHNPSTIVSELCENVDVLVEEDIKDIICLLNISQIDWSDFKKELEDYDTNYHVFDNINDVFELGDSNPITGCTVQEAMINQIDALSYLNDIITEAKEVKKDKKEKGNIINKVKEKIDKKDIPSKTKKVAEKTKKSAVGLKTNLALTGEVMKKNITKASTKEKEVSKNIDVSLSQLKKTLDQALTSNRREAIIKGSVIPSFSKIIKMGIAGGILYKINPALAAITILGSFGYSKLLNNRERNLLVDEIEIELQVVDKELEKAERDDNTSEYRRLLAFKKKLQRERQRLIYKIKVYSNNKIDSEVN